MNEILIARMNELLKEINGLNAARADEETFMCFVTDLEALNLTQVNALIDYYTLRLTKGPNFEQRYKAIQERVKAGKAQQKLLDDKAKGEADAAKSTVGKEVQMPEVSQQ